VGLSGAGLVTVGGVNLSGHECWSFNDQHLFDAYARDVVLGALAAGEWVWYVAGRHSRLTAESLPEGDAMRVFSAEEVYRGQQVVDPAAQVAVYAAATRDAVAAGFTGLRVVADATDLVRTDEQRDAFARYEYLVGRYMRSAPMRALCAYDSRELGGPAVAELACLHESSRGADVTFQLHAGPTGAEAVLDGELDPMTEQLFTTALRHTDLASAGGRVVLDGTGLRFIDHRSLITLQRYAGSCRLTAVLRTRSRTVARLAGLLELPQVHVEVVA
jgi:hypothetical protein